MMSFFLASAHIKSIEHGWNLYCELFTSVDGHKRSRFREVLLHKYGCIVFATNLVAFIVNDIMVCCLLFIARGYDVICQIHGMRLL